MSKLKLIKLRLEFSIRQIMAGILNSSNQGWNSQFFAERIATVATADP
jgi:hypothetical protein